MVHDEVAVASPMGFIIIAMGSQDNYKTIEGVGDWPLKK